VDAAVVVAPRGPPTSFEDCAIDLAERRLELSRAGVEPTQQAIAPFGIDATEVPDLARRTGWFEALDRPIVADLFASDGRDLSPAEIQTGVRVLDSGVDAVRTRRPEIVSELIDGT
jgi:hypothetical protein